MTDLELAFNTLRAKSAEYDTYFHYAEGNQPLKYSTTRLAETFQNLTATFNQNWMAVIVDTSLDRLTFKGWGAEDQAVNDDLKTLYDDCQIAIDSYDTHKAALITHESYIIAWKEEEEIEVYYNDPRMCHVFYEADHPKKKRFAAKWFKGNDDRYHITLYYPDRLEYYVTDPMKSTSPASANAFKAAEPPTATNPYGVIPVFHFVINKRSGVSELTNVLTLQDAVNKLLADMMISAEFGAFKQRWIITTADIKTLKNAPNEIWKLPPGDGLGQGTQVGEFSGTDLDNYLGAIDKLANSIAIISRTPKHYFYSAGANVSGEALMAMEAPLVAKVEQYQTEFSVTWKELGAFLEKLNGKDVPISDIKLFWEPVQAVQPKTEADTIKVLLDSKIPLAIVLKWAGKSEQEIKEITDQLAKEKKEQATQAKLMLEKLKIEQAQSNNPGVPPQQEEGANPQTNLPKAKTEVLK